MKKRPILVALSLVCVLCLVLSSCALIIPTTLPAPVVTIDSNGVASWQAVEHATGYIYKIDGGEEITTANLSVQLQLGQTIQVKAFGYRKYYSDSAFSAPQTYQGAKPTTLATPVVTISNSGVASWNAIENALGYKYKIDDGAETATGNLSVKLSNGQQIAVKAVGDNVTVFDSQYCEPETYTAPEPPAKPTQLTSPVVTVSLRGVASWQANSNADGYKYSINGGNEVFTRDLSVQLSNIGDSITVKACGDGVYYSDSEMSQAAIYEIPADCPHIDDNNDTICDVCNESVLAELSFLSINDLHGKFMDTSTQPGLDEMTTYLKNLYEDPTREEILLSPGDMWQGTAESSITKGKLMTTWMNEVDFAAMALGNHEFDWGVNSIAEAAALAKFPILGINVTVNGVQPSYIKSSVTVEKAGVKIGIIGAIGNCYSSISSEMSVGVSFATDSALTNLVKAESNRLRQQEGCDVVVYILHDGRGQSYNNTQDFASSDFHSGSDSNRGYIYYDVELSNGYVDLVFESHTHQNYILRDEYGVYHLQGASENRNISLADVSFNTVTKQIVSVYPNKIPVSEYANSNIPGDPAVQDIYNQFFPDVDLYASIGTNSAQRNSDTITGKVAELYYELGRETWGSYNVVLGGGYLNVRNPYNLYAGSVSYADIFTLLPFDNQIVLGKIRGSSLKSNFFNKDSYTCYAPNLTASDVVDSEYYYIVVDSYTSTYSRNNITEIARYTPGVYARDLIADFIKDGGWGYGQIQQISIAQALQIGNGLADNATTTESYKITGTIKNIASTTYGNMYITDSSTTSTLYIYGLYYGNTRYDKMTNPPQVGDTITIVGQITKYVSTSTTIEIKNALLQ